MNDYDDFTGWVRLQKVLDYCGKHGVTRVAVGMRHESVPRSMTFPWMNESVVQYPNDARDEDGIWPTIWKAVEIAGVSGGCGNHAQHQLCSNHSIPIGVWHYIKGEWVQIV